MKVERRALMEKPALREADSGQTVTGYAAVFGSEADIGGWWREQIKPGAFTKAIQGDVRALVDHDSGRVIGRTVSGTLRLAEDDHGLAVEIDLPDTTDGRDIGALIARGDVTGMSFGFVVTHDEWDETVDPPVRTIHEVDLFEVSAVAFPAYEATEISLRDRTREIADARKEGRRSHNAQNAAQRIALRKAVQDQKFRGLRPAPRD